MASAIKNFLGYLKLGNEDDEYDEYVEEFEQEENERLERLSERELRSQRTMPRERTERKTTRSYADSKSYEEPVYSDLKKERSTRSDKGGAKVIPMRKMQSGLEVCIMKPASFEDSQDICDVLLNGRAAVVNLEGFDSTEAQRIMDFISGAVYAINGKLHQISKYIFIFSPENVDISGDYMDLVPEEGFGVPTLNKEF